MLSTSLLFLALPLAACASLVAPTPAPLLKRVQHLNNAHHKRQGLSLLSSGVMPASEVSAMLASMVSGSESTAAATMATSAVSGSQPSAGGEATAVASSRSGGTTTSAPSESSGVAEAAASQGAAPAANLDATVFNLALTLEKLESSFYAQALKKFDVSAMVQAGFNHLQATIIIEQIQVIAIDESAHVTAITGALQAAGAAPFDGCSFNFDSVLADPLTFISVARTLEAVGVSAYLGAARLLTDPALLTAAASILTLEARHQTLLNVFNGGSAATQAFDIALGPEQVLALAGGFLTGCQASDLGLVANQPLSVTSGQATTFSAGSKLDFSSTTELSLEGMSCQMIIGGAAVAQVFDASSCCIPEGIDGPVTVYLTNDTTPLQSNLINQDARGIQAGPGLIFVDSKPSAFGSLFTVQQGGWGHPSADMGMLSIHRARGDTQVIQIVKQATLIETETITVVDGRGKGTDGSKQRMVKVRRGSAVA